MYGRFRHRPLSGFRQAWRFLPLLLSSLDLLHNRLEDPVIGDNRSDPLGEARPRLHSPARCGLGAELLQTRPQLVWIDALLLQPSLYPALVEQAAQEMTQPLVVSLRIDRRRGRAVTAAPHCSGERLLPRERPTPKGPTLGEDAEAVNAGPGGDRDAVLANPRAHGKRSPRLPA